MRVAHSIYLSDECNADVYVSQAAFKAFAALPVIDNKYVDWRGEELLEVEAMERDLGNLETFWKYRKARN